MLDRVILMICATDKSATVNAGRIKQAKESEPVAGSKFSPTAKASIKSMPSQKDGMAVKISATMVNTLSAMEFFLIAMYTPRGMDMTDVRKISSTASSSVVGNRSAISLTTLPPVL